MMPTAQLRVTELFFNSKKVIDRVDAARRRVLSRQGAFVRTAARSSIRKRKKASAPGQPPSSHEGSLKRFLLFYYDPQAETVVIGPQRTSTAATGVGGEPATQVLEYGGDVLMHEVQRKGRWVRRPPRAAAKEAGYGARTRVRRARVAARPYMAPALERAMKDLAKDWKGEVR